MGQFDFFAKIGATSQAVATLNDQPYIITTLVLALVAIMIEIGVIMAIHYMTMKPEQKKKKKKDEKKPAASR